jgi:hypothetical protein
VDIRIADKCRKPIGTTQSVDPPNGALWAMIRKARELVRQA